MSLGFGFKITLNSISNDRSVAARAPLAPSNIDFEDDPLDYEPDEGSPRAPDRFDVPPLHNGVSPGHRGSRQSSEPHERGRARERSPINWRMDEEELPAHRGTMIVGARRYNPDYIPVPPVRPHSTNGSIMEDGDSDSISITVDDGYELDLTNEEEERLLRDEEERSSHDDEEDQFLCDDDDDEEEVERSETVPRVNKGVVRPIVKTAPTFKVRLSCNGDKRSVLQSVHSNDWNVPLVDRTGTDKVSLYDVGCVEVDEPLEGMEEEEDDGVHHMSDEPEEEEERRVPASIPPLFKQPLPLSPAKRPPSRPKRSPTRQTPPPTPVPPIEDDAISIAASVPEELEVDVASERTSRIKGWLDETSKKAETNATHRSLNPLEIRKLRVFDGLCFNHFFGNRCTRHCCTHAHSVPVAHYAARCKHVSKHLLMKAYRYALDYDLLYRSMYEAFLIAFGANRMQRELLECIPHLLVMGVAVPHAFDCLIKQLVVTGLSYLKALDVLLHDDNLNNHPELGNVLLELLSEPQDLEMNFPFIKRITLFQSHIPGRLADKIISRILGRYPCDKKLCRDVYNLLFELEMTDPSMISESNRKALETLCKVAITVPSLDAVQTTRKEPQANSQCSILFPDRPVIGSVFPTIVPDGTLHRLMPDFDPSTRTSIKSSDVFLLQNALRDSDGGAFLKVFRRNDDVKALESFAVTFISYVRNSEDVAGILEKLLESLDNTWPDYTKDMRLKIVLEVTVMNLLVELDGNRKWRQGKVLIERFLDWDGLAGSQVFCQTITHIGRYILLAKTLALGGSLFYAHEVLQRPELMLTEPSSSWPWPTAPSDESNRNLALETIFKHGDHSHFAEVLNLYRKVLRHAEMKELFCDRFNSLVRSLLLSDSVPNLLALMQSIDVFADVMELNHLRSYLILLSTKLQINDLMRLYEICCSKGLYTSFQGIEKEFWVRTDMGDDEILTILTSFFSKLVSLRTTPFHDLRIRIDLPESKTSTNRYYRSMSDVNIAVRQLMKDKFLICCSDWSSDVTTVVVPVSELRAFLAR